MHLSIRKSTAAARELAIPYHRLIGLIRYGLIVPPAKDTSGDYIWTDTDIALARQVIESRHAGLPQTVGA